MQQVYSFDEAVSKKMLQRLKTLDLDTVKTLSKESEYPERLVALRLIACDWLFEKEVFQKERCLKQFKEEMTEYNTLKNNSQPQF